MPLQLASTISRETVAEAHIRFVLGLDALRIRRGPLALALGVDGSTLRHVMRGECGGFRTLGPVAQARLVDAWCVATGREPLFAPAPRVAAPRFVLDGSILEEIRAAIEGIGQGSAFYHAATDDDLARADLAAASAIEALTAFRAEVAQRQRVRAAERAHRDDRPPRAHAATISRRAGHLA